jgi:hypothetical protein
MTRGIRICMAAIVLPVLVLCALQQRQYAGRRPTLQSAAPQAPPELQSLIQALEVPEKRMAALESLRIYKGPREPALPALTKILEGFDIEERAGVAAAEIVSAFDSNNRDAALALRSGATRGTVLVRRTCLQGLGHFPDFWDDTIDAVLNGIGGPNGNTPVAYDTLQPLAANALPVLFQRFSESHDGRVLNRIYEIWSRSQKGDVIRQLIEKHQAVLINVLETTDQNAFLNFAAVILYSIETPESKAALAADRARRNAVSERVAKERNARQTEPQTLEQITASIRPSDDPSEELRSVSLDHILDDELLLSEHRADTGGAVMEVWQKQGDKYRLLRSIPLDGGTVSEFEPWAILTFSGNQFLHVGVHYFGTGSFRDDHVYHIDPVRHSLDDVKIVSAPGEFKFQPDEEIQRGEQVNFSDNSITFWFGIWRKGSCGACSFDSVTGTYEIKNENGAWVMRPAEMRRTGKR